MKDAYICGLQQLVFTKWAKVLNSEGVQIWEGALILLLALGSTDLSEALQQWKYVKKEFVDEIDEFAKEIKNESYERFLRQLKHMRCFLFLKIMKDNLNKFLSL